MSRNTTEKHLLIIGISGVTCGGKTTTATQLKDILPNTTLFSQDDYYLDVKDPGHIWIPELNHINFDVITSLDMRKMYEDVLHFINVNNLKPINCMDKIICETNGSQYGVDIVKILCEKIKELQLGILIIEGFSVFNYKPMQSLFNIKYYFTLDREECFKRRIRRVYEPPDCPGYFNKCVWPEHLKQLHEVNRDVRDVKYFDGCSKNSVDKILKDILQYLQK